MFEPLEFEIWFSTFVQGFSGASLDSFFLVLTWLGNPVIWIALAAFLYWKGDEKKSFFLAITILFASALVGILKPVLGRLRPNNEEFRVIVHEIDSIYGLPSGHATTIAGIFGYYLEKFKKNAKIIGLAIVLLVLLSRIYLGAHFLGDVALGGLFGFFIGRLVHALEKGYSKIKFNQKKLLEEIGLGTAIAFALIISLGLRQLELGMVFLGFFAGAFAFKLLNLDSARLSGQKLWAKQLYGFAGLGMIVLAGVVLNLLAEFLFLGGLWITLIYPVIYEKSALNNI